MGKTKRKNGKGRKKHYHFGFEHIPANPYSKKLKLVDSIVIGATEDGYSQDAKDFSFFKLHGTIYVLVEQLVFKYQPKEEHKYAYMEGMYEPAIGESVSNKTYGYPNWMSYDWEELEGIKRLGLGRLTQAMDSIPWDDNIEMDKYLQNDNNFFPGEFTEGFVLMDEQQQNMFLSLLSLKEMVGKLISEREARDEEEIECND